MCLSGFLLGTMPLIHTHSFLVGSLYAGMLLGLNLIKEKGTLVAVGYFARGMLVSAAALPWILGKEGMVSFVSGWVTGTFEGSRPRAAMLNWITPSTSTGLLLILGALFFRNRGRSAGVLLALFLCGNVVQLAQWDWDQIKFFVALYAIALLVWRETLDLSSRWRLSELAALLLIVPGAYELAKLVADHPPYVVYTAADIEVANRIRENTEPDAIIAAAPDHNSGATISGRRLYYGYEGTLSSHGIEYSERQSVMQEQIPVGECTISRRSPVCPTHLLWTERERRYFKREEPRNVVPTSDVALFLMPNRKTPKRNALLPE